MVVTSQPADSKATAMNTTILPVHRGGQLTGMFFFKKVVVSSADTWDSG
jgi:hypothetical protein